MKITIESTAEIVDLNGVPARVWEGISERGVKVHCFVTRIAVYETEDSQQFDEELRRTTPPLVDRIFPASLIL